MGEFITHCGNPAGVTPKVMDASLEYGSAKLSAQAYEEFGWALVNLRMSRMADDDDAGGIVFRTPTFDMCGDEVTPRDAYFSNPKTFYRLQARVAKMTEVEAEAFLEILLG